MASFAALADEIAARFDLGPEADLLVQYVLGRIAAEQEGLDGFLKKFKNAGLEAEAESWRGGHAAVPLSVRQVKKALGAAVIKEVAKGLGVPQGFASKLLGYAIPRIIGLLRGDGANVELAPGPIPMVPSWPRQSLSPSAVGLHSEAHFPRRGLTSDVEVAGLRLLAPAVALLITVALFGYAMLSSAAFDHSAAIAAGGNSAAITDFLKAASPVRKTTDDFGGQAAELKHPMVGFDSLGRRPAQALLAGHGFNADGAWGGDHEKLQALTIHFAPDSAKIPSRSLLLLKQAAGMIENLPAGTVVQINGYSDGSGNRTAILELSQRRADFVDLALIYAGVNPAVLSPRGFGGASFSISSNGTTDRHSNVRDLHRDNRRVEFHIVEQRS